MQFYTIPIFRSYPELIFDQECLKYFFIPVYEIFVVLAAELMLGED